MDVKRFASYAQNKYFATLFSIENPRRYFHHDRCTRKRSCSEFLMLGLRPFWVLGPRIEDVAPRGEVGVSFIELRDWRSVTCPSVCRCGVLPEACKSLVECGKRLFLVRVALPGGSRRGSEKVSNAREAFCIRRFAEGGIGNGTSWKQTTVRHPRGPISAQGAAMEAAVPLTEVAF